jgi:hypothetical protein
VLAEDVPKQLYDEFERRVLVVVKEKLNRRVDGGRLVHENPRGHKEKAQLQNE